MKVFAATSERQGERPSDFCWTVEGELVMFGFSCDRDRDNREGIDGGCGCRRSMAGMASSKGTTTFRVVELEVTTVEFRDMVVALLEENWPDLDRDVAVRLAAEIVDEAAALDVGPVLERRGDVIQVR